MTAGLNRLMDLERSLETFPNSVQDKPVIAKQRGFLRGRRNRKLRRPGVLMFSMKVDYDVPGIVPVLKQPTDYSCWATVTTMLYSWRDNQSRTIEDVMNEIGPKWMRLFSESNTTAGILPFADHDEFLAAAGLVAEIPQSFTIAAWENLLKTYGPIWVTSDERLGYGQRFHARLIVGMHGDGTPSGTTLTIIDPGTGTKSNKERFSQFVKKYEELVTETGITPPQVIHLHADARKSTVSTQSYRRPGTFGGPAAVAIPIVGIGYTIISEALQNKGDITWELKKMEGAKHPNDNKKLYDRGPWTWKTFKSESWIENLLTDRISAKFEVKFAYNGHSVGFISMQNARTNDAVSWGVHVSTEIMPHPQVYQIKDQKALAAVDVTFNYRFFRSIGADSIRIERFTLFGNGDVAEDSRWTQ